MPVNGKAPGHKKKAAKGQCEWKFLKKSESPSNDDT
jgi:hypothetical protein